MLLNRKLYFTLLYFMNFIHLWQIYKLYVH